MLSPPTYSIDWKLEVKIIYLLHGTQNAFGEIEIPNGIRTCDATEMLYFAKMTTILFSFERNFQVLVSFIVVSLSCVE